MRFDRRRANLTPELDVTDLASSIAFYSLLGFHVEYDRPDEAFAFLAGSGAELMLQGMAGPGRRFRTATLEVPFGRGVSFQLEVDDVERAYRAVLGAGHDIVLAMEERWYQAGTDEVGHRQFVVADPDGYLIRPFTSLGTRPSARTDV